jgi:uncharacterized protein
MFHLFLALTYIIPNIYVFFRIKYLFIDKRYQWLYFTVYLLLAGIYPLTETLSHGPELLMEVLSHMADYLLPFFLYLFLSVILFDLFLLLNLLIRVVSAETRKRFSFRFRTLSSMIFLAAGIVIAGVINLNITRVTKYRIEVPKRRSQTDHVRIAFVADLHIRHDTRLKFIEQYAGKMKALQPDFIFYGGDLAEENSEEKNADGIKAVLGNLHLTCNAYGVPGNHEYYGVNGQADFIRESGIILLRDTVIKIDSLFYLVGRIDKHSRKRQTIGDLLNKIPHDLPVIILDHRPTELQEVSGTIADIQFSGHTHNGQLFPINLITRFVYDLSWGYRKISNTHFFVTSGLRLWGPPVKTAGKSEIMLVDVYFVP